MVATVIDGQPAAHGLLSALGAEYPDTFVNVVNGPTGSEILQMWDADDPTAPSSTLAVPARRPYRASVAHAVAGRCLVVVGRSAGADAVAYAFGDPLAPKIAQVDAMELETGVLDATVVGEGVVVYVDADGAVRSRSDLVGTCATGI